MKVSLIYPGKNPEFAVAPPLNLTYIASYLEKNNVEVNIIDELAGQDVKKKLGKFSPDIVGITATTPLAPRAYEILSMCREMGFLTVMGGVHASVLPEEALKYSDIVVVGEGERAMMDIINKNIKSGIVSSPYIENLDELPPPATHLIDMKFYLRIIGNAFLHHIEADTPTGGIITGRGCPFRCIFCHNSWRKTPFRFHSPERVIEEVKMFIEKYGVGALFFFDDHMFVPRQRFMKFCELMEKNKIEITWGCNSRVDAVDSEILQTAYKAGCREISFGFESGSQRILDFLNKKTTVEQNRKAIELCNEASILVDSSFIIGNPTETIEDVRLTQEFIRKNKIDFAGICIATPFPGTVLWQWCKENNLIPEHVDWSKFTVNQIAIPACNTISQEDILKLFEETDALVSSKKRKISFSWFVKTLLNNPVNTIKMVRRTEPKNLIKYLKRVGI